MPFAEKLSQLRKERGLTQQELAHKVGVGISQMKRYEGGKSSPTLDIIKKLSITLAVSADDLIFDANEGLASTKILDRKLLKQFELVSKMDLHDQYVIKSILDSMILKSQIEEIIPAQTDSLWSKEMNNVVTELRKGAKKYSDDEIDDIVDDAVQAVREDKQGGRQAVGS